MPSFAVRSRSALAAFAVFLGLLIPSVVIVPGADAAVPAPPSETELIANGSFETGDFTGWTAADMGRPYLPLGVYRAGDRNSPIPVVPTDGIYAVGHGFDGGGPDTIEFWQEVEIPAGVSAPLSFDWRVSYNHSGLPRTFDISVEPTGGGTPLMTERIYTSSPDERDLGGFEPFAPDTSLPGETTIPGPTGQMSTKLDLSGFAGSTVRINFVATIPEEFTGPGSMQIDNVSLLVSDTQPPVISLVGDDPQVITVGSSYVELGATVADNYDKDLVAKIDATDVDTAVAGVYSVLYDAVDTSGNKAVQVTRTVKVVDGEAPVISLVGVDPQVITVGWSYVELGATVADNYDKNLFAKIDATDVDTAVAGVYSVLYDAVDTSGNKAVQVVRTVKVVPSDYFVDDDESVFEADVNWLAAAGITFGCNAPVNDRYCPDGLATRGQVAAFMHRAMPDLPAVRAAVDFADDDGSKYESDIEWMYSRGITEGTSATTFSPASPVTRGQMAAFLRRALPDLPAVRAAVDFADDDASIFESDIEWMYSRGITEGTSSTTFNPTGSVTRGQMAAFLHRALGS